MQNEDEQALLALANPLVWNQHDNGTWVGRTEGREYFIESPRSPDDVDADLRMAGWMVGLHIPDVNWISEVYVATAEQGKQLCLRHILTGGGVESFLAFQAASHAEGLPFIKARRTALKQIGKIAKVNPPPALNWPEDDPSLWHFSASGTRGVYRVRFEPEQRWIVTVLSGGAVTDEHRFLTRAIARAACDLHSHTGQWGGTL